eukprot:GDKJ01036908.1.p1 GENE.GDKJ01036908.1~~GDKJ01036908.1.p1  ORF type:complete len:1079 (-),score=212.25 GDKJ01036908.1:102-3314(-)
MKKISGTFVSLSIFLFLFVALGWILGSVFHDPDHAFRIRYRDLHMDFSKHKVPQSFEEKFVRVSEFVVEGSPFGDQKNSDLRFKKTALGRSFRTKISENDKLTISFIDEYRCRIQADVSPSIFDEVVRLGIRLCELGGGPVQVISMNSNQVFDALLTGVFPLDSHRFFPHGVLEIGSSYRFLGISRRIAAFLSILPKEKVSEADSSSLSFLDLMKLKWRKRFEKGLQWSPDYPSKPCFHSNGPGSVEVDSFTGGAVCPKDAEQNKNVKVGWNGKLKLNTDVQSRVRMVNSLEGLNQFENLNSKTFRVDIDDDEDVDDDDDDDPEDRQPVDPVDPDAKDPDDEEWFYYFDEYCAADTVKPIDHEDEDEEDDGSQTPQEQQTLQDIRLDRESPSVLLKKILRRHPSLEELDSDGKSDFSLFSPSQTLQELLSLYINRKFASEIEQFSSQPPLNPLSSDIPYSPFVHLTGGVKITVSDIDAIILDFMLLVEDASEWFRFSMTPNSPAVIPGLDAGIDRLYLKPFAEHVVRDYLPDGTPIPNNKEDKQPGQNMPPSPPPAKDFASAYCNIHFKTYSILQPNTHTPLCLFCLIGDRSISRMKVAVTHPYLKKSEIFRTTWKDLKPYSVLTPGVKFDVLPVGVKKVVVEGVPTPILASRGGSSISSVFIEVGDGRRTLFINREVEVVHDGRVWDVVMLASLDDSGHCLLSVPYDSTFGMFSDDVSMVLGIRGCEMLGLPFITIPSLTLNRIVPNIDMYYLDTGRAWALQFGFYSDFITTEPAYQNDCKSGNRSIAVERAVNKFVKHLVRCNKKRTDAVTVFLNHFLRQCQPNFDPNVDKPVPLPLFPSDATNIPATPTGWELNVYPSLGREDLTPEMFASVDIPLKQCMKRRRPKWGDDAELNTKGTRQLNRKRLGGMPASLFFDTLIDPSYINLKQQGSEKEEDVIGIPEDYARLDKRERELLRTLRMPINYFSSIDVSELDPLTRISDINIPSRIESLVCEGNKTPVESKGACSISREDYNILKSQIPFAFWTYADRCQGTESSYYRDRKKLMVNSSSQRENSAQPEAAFTIRS